MRLTKEQSAALRYRPDPAARKLAEQALKRFTIASRDTARSILVLAAISGKLERYFKMKDDEPYHLNLGKAAPRKGKYPKLPGTTTTRDELLAALVHARCAMRRLRGALRRALGRKA